jgi:uncharacterized protein YneF (UPF0154 family)
MKKQAVYIAFWFEERSLKDNPRISVRSVKLLNIPENGRMPWK